MNLDGAARGDEALLHGLLFIAVLAEALLALPSLEDDIDVAGDQGGDLFAWWGSNDKSGSTFKKYTKQASVSREHET